MALYGLIGVLGARIWVESRVELRQPGQPHDGRRSGWSSAIANFSWEPADDLLFTGIALGTLAHDPHVPPDARDRPAHRPGRRGPRHPSDRRPAAGSKAAIAYPPPPPPTHRTGAVAYRVVQAHPRLGQPRPSQAAGAAGIDAEVIVSGVDESAVAAIAAGLSGTRPAKAEAVAARGPDPGGARARLRLGARLRRRDPRQARRRRRGASTAGRRCAAARGVLHTGHCLIDIGTGKRPPRTVGRRTVHFADLTDDEIDAYVATGEPLHVAGAFTIDGLGGAVRRPASRATTATWSGCRCRCCAACSPSWDADHRRSGATGLRRAGSA